VRAAVKSIGGAVERQDLVAADVARVVVEEPSDRVGLVGHGGEVVFGNAELRQPRLESEIAVRASDACGDVVLVAEAERVEDVRGSISYGGRIEGERVREDQRAGEPVGDMVPRAERTLGGQGLLEGAATLLSSHAEPPGPATSDIAKGSQAHRPTA
jgi:hypothetical protein